MRQTLLENHMIPNAKGEGSDIFQTPKEAAEYLVPFLPKGVRIWESACGKGLLVKWLREYGYCVLGTDISENPGYNFFEYTPPEWDIQVTNPPYSIKDDWLEHSFELEKPFALLLPVNALHSVRRCKLYRKYGIQLVVPPKRINFITPSGEGSGAWFPVMWFTHGLNLSNDLIFKS
jgi:hypothetical protein